jgi:dipeptidyl aminopeptidase/acylaminoacyl peptidase
MLRIAIACFFIGCSGSPKTAVAPPTTGGDGTPKAPDEAPPAHTPAARTDATPDPVTKNAREVELAKQVIGYLDAFTNNEPAFTADGKRVVFVSSRDGLPQLYVAGTPEEPATRILATKERVTTPLPTAEGKSLLFRSDVGADEQWSIFRVNLDGSGLVELTPGKQLMRDKPMIPEGRPSLMYFSARERTSAKSMVYTASTTAPSEPKLIFTDDKPAFLSDVSPDGKRALVLKFPSRSENYVHVLDVDTGKTSLLFPSTGKVSISSAELTPDGKRVLIATDNGEEQALVLSLDAKTGKQLAKYAFTPATATINGITVAREGGVIAVSAAVGSKTEIHLLDARTLVKRAAVQLPLGAGVANEFSKDGKRLAVTWSTATTPTDLFAVDARTGKAEPLRKEARPSLRAIAIDTSVVELPAFDGGKIPTNVYVPSGEGTKKHPVILWYHGGPSAVETVGWRSFRAFFLELGYVWVEPNVRGSTGYGRAYEAGDNGPKRLDAFKDIESSSRWAASQPWADKDRVVLFGGSYGGYTTLIGLTRFPDIYKVGVNLFGVANLDTFMKTTSGLIREIFLVEFGDPDKDKDFLRSISPLEDVAKIVDPLFVYAGANDPRVPRSESDLIVRALRRRQVPVEYMVSENEGHSISRRENQIELFSRVARFLEQHLK